MGTIADLAVITNALCAYFQHKHPSADTMDEWYKTLSNYHLSPAKDHIIRQITSMEGFPRNLPASIKQAYFTWLKNQPRSEENAEGCEYCLIGEGVIHAIKEYWGIPYVFAFRCGHCNSSNLQFPTATREWLFSNGYKLDWQHDFDGVIDKGLVKKFVGNKHLDEIPF